MVLQCRGQSDRYLQQFLATRNCGKVEVLSLEWKSVGITDCENGEKMNE